MDSNFAAVIADLDTFGTKDASAALAEFAAETSNEVIQAENPSSVVAIVDGHPGAPLSTVSPTGIIEFDFGYAGDIAEQVYTMLIAASPYRPKRSDANPDTHYRDEHLIRVNGEEVNGLPSNLPSDAEVTFINLQPYARKIEAGLSIEAPNGVYEAVAIIARQRFGNSADISFTYVDDGDLSGGARQARRSKSKDRAKHRYPSITVKALQT